MEENELEIKQVTSSDVAVSDRRQWLAEQYLNHHAVPALLFREYRVRYGLSKHSFDKDITAVRNEVGTSVRDNYDSIVNDLYGNLQALILKAIDNDDTNTQLTIQKQLIDLLKLAKEKTSVNNKGTIINVHNAAGSNTVIPQLSKEEIYKLLGKKEDEYPTTIDITPDDGGI